MRMHNPPHPGKAVRAFIGEMTITEAAARLGVTRASLSRIINGTNGISADMALRLSAALGTSAEMWLTMQAKYDLWQAEDKPRPDILPFRTMAHA
ncbi:HigA family addiction module antitoxin [Castellaniella hirudinis]|uniref:HigA family addiction module antitoxin n=1 Tax=Castellaniella hirudinis TaxID=1144617 RepID=UPI0039C208F8